MGLPPKVQICYFGLSW